MAAAIAAEGLEGVVAVAAAAAAVACKVNLMVRIFLFYMVAYFI
ncbi:MAG: hypothetical protein AAGK05_18415 [Pseudomonadota bacterium]